MNVFSCPSLIYQPKGIIMRRFSNIFRVLCIIVPALAFAWSTSCGGVANTLLSIAVTPATPSIAAGATQQFTATATYSDGTTQDITLTVTWASSDVTVAAFETPDTNGLATVIAAGTATISATDTDSGIVGSTDMTVAALSGTIMSLYSNGTNWNDYIANDGADMFTATDTACDAAAAGPGYNACLNGGLIRSVEVTGRGVCDGLTATDSLGVFNWVCDNTTNDVRMVSVGFADGMGLSDLVDFDTAAWQQMNMTVSRGGNAYLATDVTSWWGNTIVVNNTGAAMNEGEVHIVTVNNGSSYNSWANKATLLIKPGLTITAPPAATNMIDISSKDFVWIEGSIDATGKDIGVLFDVVRFSQLRNIKASNGNTFGIRLTNSSNNQIRYSTVANNLDSGIYFDNSTNNLLSDFSSTNNGAEGVELINSSSDNIFLNTTSASNEEGGVYVLSSTNNVFTNLSAPNDGSYGIFFGTVSDRNTLMNAVAVNQGGNGIWLNVSSNATFANIAMASAGTIGIRLVNSNNNYFTGLVKVGNNAADCAATGTDPGIDNNCDPQGPISDFGSPVTGVSLDNSFVAKVSSDSVNVNGATGTEIFGNITDWVNFENIFRGWGNEGIAFPDSTNQDPCTAGDCRIWDWSLVSADTIIRDVLSLPTGSDTLTHTWSNASTTTFLRNAVEILDDGIGNENGLCESNETCIYTPNIGSYQGHGSLISAGDFTDGTITGVTLMQYETNGR